LVSRMGSSVHRQIRLKVIPAPAIGPVVQAPPVIVASTNTIDYLCGRCGTLLLHAEIDQIHNLLIHCTACGAYNSTDI